MANNVNQQSACSKPNGILEPRSVGVLKRLWVRELGLSFKISKLRSCDQLPSSEQFFFAVLRKDIGGSRKLLLENSSNQIFFNELLVIALESGLASILLNELIESEFAKHVPTNQFERLAREIATQTATQDTSDRSFRDLLKILSPVSRDLIWIKGSSLSQVIFKDNNMRRYGDFDVVVPDSKFEETLNLLTVAGFSPDRVPSSCNQIGVGPTDSFADLLLVPTEGLIPSSVTTMKRPGHAPIDVKLGPFDRGLQMCQLNRFFADAIAIDVRGQQFMSPSLLDHMLIGLHTFAKDRFRDWKVLYDIHLLGLELTKQPQLWEKLVDCCKCESIEADAWVGLVMAADRLGTPVPHSVLDALAPNDDLIHRIATMGVSPYFVWNATSLPMLLANAFVSTDKERKLQLLRRAFLPSKAFISKYYNAGRSFGPLHGLILMLAHWAVLMLPGGLVRRTFGPMLWTPKYSFRSGSQSL
jgi:hypothetical protein